MRLKRQLLGLAERQDLLDLLTRTLPTPAQFLSCPEGSSDGQHKINPKYNKWRQSNRLLRRWIIGTLTKEALGIRLDNKAQVWQALKEAYAHQAT